MVLWGKCNDFKLKVKHYSKNKTSAVKILCDSGNSLCCIIRKIIFVIYMEWLSNRGLEKNIYHKTNLVNVKIIITQTQS